MHKKVTRYFVMFMALVLMASCTKFRKIQKSGDWKVKYDAALEYYEAEDYYRSGILLEEIIPIIRGTEEAEYANFIFAYTYFYQGQYLMSAHYFKNFAQVYGRSQYVEEAQYQFANSQYMQSPDESLDQTSTYEALTALQNFLNRYPYSEFAERSESQINELQVKLERKAYENAKLYHKLSRYKAALVTFDNFAKDYPDSEYNEELSFLAVETIFELAQISIYSRQEERYKETIDRYQTLVDKYPESKYLKTAGKFYEESVEQLHIFADRKSEVSKSE